MFTILIIHIIAGGLGLVSGYVALHATKGASLHRRSGMFFVSVMLTMSITGALMAAVSGVWVTVNVPAGLITAYLVTTSLTTVRSPSRATSRWLNPALMLFALAIGVTCLTFGVEALAAGGERNGIPAFPFFLFGVVGTLGALLDLRMIRAGGLSGASRLARHLWRMCFALFIAAMSFFLGQADEFPAALRLPALLAIPVLVPVVSMLYWLWKVRIRNTFRGMAGVPAPEAVR